MANSKSEKIRREIERNADLVLEIINRRISKNQKIFLVKKYFDEIIIPLLEEYDDNFALDTNVHIADNISSMSFEQSVRTFHNIILSAKKRNTDTNKKSIRHEVSCIKYFVEKENNIENRTHIKETLLKIQNEVLELSDCLKNIDDNITKEINNTTDFLLSEIQKSVVVREKSIDKLMLFEENFEKKVLLIKEEFNIPNNIAKKQHYIPQFFQRYWRSIVENNKDKEESCILVYRYIKETNVFTSVQIRNCCQQKNLYEFNKSNPSNYFEKLYSKTEYEISTQLQEMFNTFKTIFFTNNKPDLKKITNTMMIDEQQKMMLIKFFSHLSARHPNSVYNNIENINNIDSFELTKIQKKFHNYNNLNRNSKERLVLNYLALENHKIEDKLINSNYKVQIAISDEPNIFFCDTITDKIISKENEYFLPVSPYILVRFSKNVLITDKKIIPINKTIYEKFVYTYFNNKTVNEIYGIEKKYINNILKIVNNKQKIV